MSVIGRLFPERFAKPSQTEEAAQEATDTSREDSVAGERGIASVNRVRSLQSRMSNLLAMGLMLALGLGLLSWYYAQTFSRQAHARQTAQAVTRSKADGEMALPALGRVDPPMMERALGPPPDLPMSASLRTASYETSSAPALSSVAAPSPRTTDRRLDGPAFSEPTNAGNAGGGRTGSGGPPLVPTTEEAATDPEGEGPTAGSAGSVAALLRPSVTPAVRAHVLPTQQMLLPKGAFIDCTLETAIDSSLPGLTTCITATDTFGADGKVVLLERGTKLIGETRGEVQQGSARVFVLWTEARTPTGVVVPLASPGTDELGRSGMAGTVDRHFLQRFGAAMLISVIDGAIQAAVQSRSSGGTVIYSPSGSQDVLTEVLKGTINIPPTVRKQNGDRIQVLVARDLDFRSVYELRTTSPSR